MIDVKLLRADPQVFIKAAADKNIKVDFEALLEADRRLLSAQQELQEIKTRQNRQGEMIAKIKGPERQAAIAEMAQLKERAKELAGLIDELEPKLNEQLLLVPQPADPEVPYGKDDTQNVELRRWGQVRQFDFEPKDHIQLGADLDIIDVDRGVKLAGSRNYILKGAGSMLHQAVLRLAMDQMLAKGYLPMTVPVLVREEVMYGTGYFPVGRDQAYLAERDGLSLVGTAEVPVTAYHSGEILSQAELPKKYVAMSTCFRREAGAAGKDTYGLYRIHLFDKVEQVIIGPNDKEQSRSLHQEILRNAEDVLQALELPYRVVNVCTGDLGQGQAQKFDIETWMPSRKGYGETHSASRFYEFQARRLNLRYRDKEGQVRYCHTLNNTVIASPRVLIALLELYQNADGTVTVPKPLRPYMQGMEKIEKRQP
jgi:seryl-tRNA synthetase